MKKLQRLTLILFVLVFNSCDKETIEENITKDFRDQYIGKYQVQEKIRSYGSPQCGIPYSRERDTIISVLYGNTDTTLQVLGREVWLDSSGYFSAYHYGLRLWNDSIFSYFMNGGLGCGENITYEGKRISDKP